MSRYRSRLSSNVNFARKRQLFFLRLFSISSRLPSTSFPYVPYLLKRPVEYLLDRSTQVNISTKRAFQQLSPCRVFFNGRCPFEINEAEPYRSCDRGLLSVRYKFYLSFENSLCGDYVTEKFFRIRHLDIVPIVLGVADYTRWTPAGTFIDVRHFRSPRHLADFIKELDADDERYMEFLLRKRLAKCRPFNDGSASGPYRERLCNHLHRNYDRIETADLRPLVDPRKACIKPAEFYRNISSLKF